MFDFFNEYKLIMSDLFSNSLYDSFSPSQKEFLLNSNYSLFYNMLFNNLSDFCFGSKISFSDLGDIPDSDLQKIITETSISFVNDFNLRNSTL
jgi:hypothetical protein